METFWERIFSKKGYITLAPGAFYILRSKEYITIPPQTAAEMVPYEVRMGEFRVHYAGFFDPGFGSRKILWTSARRLYLKLGVTKPPLYWKTVRLLVN